jgi:hypothetical protein
MFFFGDIYTKTTYVSLYMFVYSGPFLNKSHLARAGDVGSDLMCVCRFDS